MNATRWNQLYKTKDLSDEYRKLNDGYKRHTNYMSKAFGENADGYILRIINEGDDIDYLYFSDNNGIIQFPSDSPILKSDNWINAKDGSIFNPYDPLHENTSIYQAKGRVKNVR